MLKSKGSAQQPSEVKIIKVCTKSSGEVSIKLTSINPRTADAVWKALPFEADSRRWGDEIYFKIPVKEAEEKSQTVVEVGDVAYWPPGESMCIFFGATPVSEAGEPRAYSPVNVFGRVIGDPLIFKKVRNGEKIGVERR